MLYLVYIVGWAMINPKIAPPLPEEQTKVPVPDWVRKFQSAYSSNMLVALGQALLSPSKAREIEADGRRLGYRELLKNLCVALVPFALIAGTLALAWWYVVIHQQAAAEAAVTTVEQLGTPGLGSGPATPAEQGPPAGFYFWFGLCAVAGALMIVRYYWRMDADRFEVLKLLTSSVMPLGILTVVVLAVILFGITTATKSAGVGRRRRLPAGDAGQNARLETDERSRVPHREDDRHGLLAVCRLGAVFGGVRDTWRARSWSSDGCCR